MKYKIIITTLFLVLFINVYAQQGSIKLEVRNIETPEGQLYVSLYNKSKGFLKEGTEFRKLKFDIKDNDFICCMEELPEGDYAVAIYHDKNEDGECNTNWLGIPTEGYGFSRNFKPIIAPPSFKRVKIKVKGETLVKIKMLNAK